MESIDLILGRLLRESQGAQVYFLEDPDGTQSFWNVAAGRRLAQESGDLRLVSLSESGLTLEMIAARYTDLDHDYALTTNLAEPLLFIPHQGKDQLIDGWHRLAKAALIGQDEISAYFLTQEQANAILILTLPPGKGMDWGQKANAA